MHACGSTSLNDGVVTFSVKICVCWRVCLYRKLLNGGLHTVHHSDVVTHIERLCLFCGTGGRIWGGGSDQGCNNQSVSKRCEVRLSLTPYVYLHFRTR